MANKLLIKRASTQSKVPLVTDLDLGELAINTYDGRLFAKKNDGSAAIIDLKQNDPIRVLGDASSSYSWDQSTYTSNVSVTLNTVNSNVGTFGAKGTGSITIPVVTVNAKGLVTAVATETFSLSADFGTMATQDANAVAITGGSIDGTAIGATSASTGSFTDLETSGNVTVNGTLFSNDITSSSVTVSGDAIISGNLTVQGTTTTVNSTTVSIGDLNVELAKDAVNAAQANGAGITVVGPATAATITYASADDSWNLNKRLNGTSLKLSGLTNTRVLFAGASGLVSDDSDFTYNSTTDTLSVGNISVSTAVNAPTVAASSLTDTRIVFAGTDGLLIDSSDLTFTSATSTLATGNISVTNDLSATNLTASSLTATRLVFAGTGGKLVDDADLTYNSTTDTMSLGTLAAATNITKGGFDVLNTADTIDGGSY